ncbi:MAG: fibronectin type III domain-containing protein, partial [Saprospiraceae bacterium]|nr:fibronectin type III domain-containing protein [Saprospiraceae bacterium]
MKNHRLSYHNWPFPEKLLILLFVLFLSPNLFSQQITVLPENGSYSEEISPQGNLLFQRYFYLITPAEMAASGFSSGMDVNSLGFTIAAIEGDTARGKYEIYLQNTNDDASRLDTSWTYVSSATNSFDTTGLSIGTYEWQVQTVCMAGMSSYSGSSEFAPQDTLECNRPADLTTLDVNTTSATFSWTAPYSFNFVDYTVEYRISNAGAWTSVSASDTFYMAAGLAPDTSYQWRVRTNCTGGASAFTAASFSTLAPDLCNEPSALSVGLTDDTSSVLSWTEATGADYYLIQYRRVGTSPWDFDLSFTDTARITGLKAGTLYEWRIKTVCSMGEGMFVLGSNFTTSGATVCYSPQDQKANVINDSSAVLHWNAVPGAISYNLRYRLRNSIPWDSVITPMDLVHNDSITIPDTIGAFQINFDGMGISTFNYTGEGLYVAWQYTGKSGPVTTANSVLATSRNYNIKDKNGLDSITFVLGLAARNSEAATAHENVLLATNLRPQTRLGSPDLKDSVEVVVVHAQGYHALNFGDTARIATVVKNLASKDKTYIVKLRVRDQASNLLYSADSSLSILANSDTLVRFDGWIPTVEGTDSIIVSIDPEGAENVLDNNRSFYLQRVNTLTMAYDDGSDAVTSTGFGTGSGLILTRYQMAGCGNVNAARIYLDVTCTGKPVYAVIMDGSGTLIDSSDVFTPDSTQVNKYHTFYFPESPFFDSSTFYIGLAQMASAMPYNPVGVQWETTEIRDSAYYRAAIDGTGLTNQPYPGRLMIRAELVPGRTLPVILGDKSLCLAETDTLSVGSKNTRFANQVIDVSSEYGSVDFSARQALGPPDLYPDHSLSTRQWISESSDGQREHIVLGFPNPGPINFIDIYETFNVGAVDTVYVKNPGSGLFEVVYMDTASLGDTVAMIHHISFDTTTFDVSEIRIAVASDSVAGFNGIDAVGIGLESDTSNFVSYLWSTSATTPSILISTAGTYAVTVTDALGCEYADSITVTTPSQTPPIIAIKGSAATDTTFCSGGMVVLKSDQP